MLISMQPNKAQRRTHYTPSYLHTSSLLYKPGSSDAIATPVAPIKGAEPSPVPCALGERTLDLSRPTSSASVSCRSLVSTEVTAYNNDSIIEWAIVHAHTLRFERTITSILIGTYVRVYVRLQDKTHLRLPQQKAQAYRKLMLDWCCCPLPIISLFMRNILVHSMDTLLLRMAKVHGHATTLKKRRAESDEIKIEAFTDWIFQTGPEGPELED